MHHKSKSLSHFSLQFLFKDNAQPVASSVTPWEKLSSPPEALEFHANGKGEVTLAVSLTFIPSKLLPFPTFKGIFVQRNIRIGASNGPSLKTIPVKSIVEISVQVTTPDRLGASTIRVLMPAGLEPVDPNASASSTICPVPFDDFYSFRSFISCPDQVITIFIIIPQIFGTC